MNEKKGKWQRIGKLVSLSQIGHVYPDLHWSKSGLGHAVPAMPHIPHCQEDHTANSLLMHLLQHDCTPWLGRATR